MSQIHASSDLGRFLESVVRELPHDAVEALAELRPPFDQPGGDESAVEVIRLFQAKAKAALEDEPRYNADTLRAIEDVRAGRDVARFETPDDLFADLGI